MSTRAGHPVGPAVPGWTPRPRAAAVALEGRWVRLEPLGPAHAPALHEALAGLDAADLWAYRTTEQPRHLAETEALVAAVLADPGAETVVAVPTTGPAAGRAAGLASYLRIEPAHGSVEIGGVLWGPGLRRAPASTEAVHLLVAHALDTLGYRRVEWKCDSLNEPSRRAAARLGFTHEGRFRQHLVVRGHSRDTDWFALTDAEWPAVRAAHVAWLDPANHDAEGRQRTPLRVPTRAVMDADRPR